MTDAIAIRTNNISKLSTSQLDFVLLDGSGSMHLKWWDMLSALDAYIATLKAANIDSHLRLHIFDDHNLELLGRDCHIRDHRDFISDPIGAHFGGTPLYDAIVIMGRYLRDTNPQNCAITIVTDGENGLNRFASETQARAVLDWCRAHGWTVTFIGCDFDNNAQAAALGASKSNSIGVRKELLLEAAKSYGEKRVHNARSGSDINFSDDEKQKFGGYLGHGG